MSSIYTRHFGIIYTIIVIIILIWIAREKHCNYWLQDAAHDVDTNFQYFLSKLHAIGLLINAYLITATTASMNPITEK